MKKPGSEMIQEYRKQIANPETADNYPFKLFNFYRALLDGEIKTKKRGGKREGYTNKTYTQKAAKTIISAVQSFFAFHSLAISLKKYIKKDVRMRKPRVQNKKHQLLTSEIDALLKIASIRQKAILTLGLAGQDESTISTLKIGMFTGKLSAENLEFIETYREKTNEDLWILLTPEAQQILADYITSLGRREGWLFKGYKDKPMKPAQCNNIFKELCKQANIKAENNKRLTFHCCRMWFSAQLRNKVSDDLIDLLTGHAVRFGGAYLGNTEKTREVLEDANISELLRLQQVVANSNHIKRELSGHKETIQKLATQLNTMKQEAQMRNQSIEDLMKLTSFLKSEIDAFKQSKP